MNWVKAVAAAALVMGASASAQEEPQSVVEAREPIIVNGAIPHCHRRPGDPFDAVNVRNPANWNQVIVADSKGRFRLTQDFDPVTGPVAWQRAGTGINSYVFRVPTDDTPLCMGSRGAPDRSFAQLRRVLDATPFHRKFVRFTAFVAAQPRIHIRSWLAATPAGRYEILQGDLQSQPMDGTGRWEPMSITIGPIPTAAGRISYGFLLQGAGDLWITQAKIEVSDTRPADTIPVKKSK